MTNENKDTLLQMADYTNQELYKIIQDLQKENTELRESLYAANEGNTVDKRSYNRLKQELVVIKKVLRNLCDYGEKEIRL